MGADFLDWIWEFKKPARIGTYSGVPVSAKSRDKLKRVVNRSPQCMVKVSGRTHDSAHLKAHLDYVTRNGEVTAETSYGEIEGRAAVKDLHAEWSIDAQTCYGKENVRKAPLSVNMVLSMPPGTDRQKFNDAVRDFVDDHLRNKVDVVLCFHTDTNHPHAHVTVRGRDHSGRTFNPNRNQLARYREQFAEALRHRGLEADATPRYARGKGTKAQKQVLRHLEARGVAPRVTALAMKQAQERAGSASRGRSERPWERAAENRHLAVRGAYLAAARSLVQTKDASDRELATSIARFVERDMPPHRPTMQADRLVSTQEKEKEKNR